MAGGQSFANTFKAFSTDKLSMNAEKHFSRHIKKAKEKLAPSAVSTISIGIAVDYNSFAYIV